ncbi:Sec-independent protein translocase protein TatB [Sphingorhabdus sp.]|jgi:sec-independent protein translocase protein TatB|uniref:Sec-independent protein translocase protein TatB n=1 Tax=Sphingorhabdus sp. TaxID=1902408 RepID=UPI0035B2311B|nr:twin-arginine translocase subunit TatB [Sphingomonadaceae bacterium]
MFDIASGELLLVALVALLVIGPKDLPRVLRYVGQWVGKARRMASHFRSGIDEMVRQSELEELEQKWAAENERIMREHPPVREYDSLPPPEVEPKPADIADPNAEVRP